jgi:hypothetical protein
MNSRHLSPFFLAIMLLLSACASAPAAKANPLPNTGSGQQAAALPTTLPVGPTDFPLASESANATPTPAVAASPTAAPTESPTQAPTQAAVLATTAATATAAPFSVTSVDTSVSLGGINQSSYNGACQASLIFAANITANGAGTVTYFWLRSDGTRSAENTLTFSSAGYQSVADNWTLTAPAGNISASDRVTIDQPNHAAFSAAALSLTCNPVLPSATPPSSNFTPHHKKP